MRSSATYAARVSGLAVALGIGTAVATGHGIATADPADDGSSPSANDSGQSITTHDENATDASKDRDGQKTHKEPPASHVGNGREGVAEHSGTVDKSVTEDKNTSSAQDSAGELKANGVSPAGPGADEPNNVIEAPRTEAPKGPEEPTSPAPPDPGKPQPTKPRPQDDPKPVSPRHFKPQTGAPAARTIGSKPDEPTTAATVNDQKSTAPTTSTRMTVMSATSQDTAPTVHADVETHAVLVDEQPQPAPASLITNLLSALGFGPRAADAPKTPPSPLSVVLGALEWMRREMDRVFTNRPPVITYNPADNRLVDGNIVGKVTVTDPDDTEFKFSATTPAHGDLVVNPDGSFVYTPHESYTTPDSFDITVTDTGTMLTRFLNVVSFGLIPAGATDTQTIAWGKYTPTTVVSGLDEPTDFRFLPDGRMIFTEKGGAVRVADQTGRLQSTPVITLPTQTYWARGLLAVEVDPEFDDNGYIYVSYVNAQNELLLSRLTITDPNADILAADPTSEVVLVRGDQPAGDDHLGGGLAFGPDGKLYWSVGDNVCCSVLDDKNAQSLSSMYGKVLRLNPDGSAPDDNPFYDTQGANPLVYAYGFRNPYRLTWTPDGKLLVGDVGQSTWEEVNLIEPGANYGWFKAEGPCDGVGHPTCSSPSSYTDPIYAYRHPAAGASSITAVLGTGTNALGQHTVLIADFNQQWVKELTFDSDYSHLVGERTFDGAVTGSTNKLIQRPDGSVYQLTYDGRLTRIAQTPAIPSEL